MAELPRTEQEIKEVAEKLWHRIYDDCVTGGESEAVARTLADRAKKVFFKLLAEPA